MKYVLIIHEVEDYQIWKKIFDDASDLRKNAGEESYQVMKFENNNNRIIHLSVWSSIENAKTFFNSPKLLRIREKAGVISPEFIYLDLLEAGIL